MLNRASQRQKNMPFIAATTNIEQLFVRSALAAPTGFISNYRDLPVYTLTKGY